MTSWLAADRLPGLLVRLPLRLIPKGTVVPILSTRARWKRWIVGSGPHSCWLGWNEFRKRRLFSQEVQRGSVVYDIGANVGSYSILASVLVGPEGYVIAFEPVAENVDLLSRHIELNRLQNVTVLPVAVADRSGAVRFRSQPDRLRGRIGPDGTQTVSALALDDLVQRGEIPAPDYLKIDVEGGELAVLQGADDILARMRPVIFLATHGTEVQVACLRYLAQRDYHPSSINKEGDEWIARPIIDSIPSGGGATRTAARGFGLPTTG